MTGNTSLIQVISIICIIYFLLVSCQNKKAPSILSSASDGLVSVAAPTKPQPPKPLDTIGIFKQVLKNKDKSYDYENDTIEIKYGYIFSKKQKHLFIKFKNIFEYSTEFRIYNLNKKILKNIFFCKIEFIGYQGFCLLDVNNDSYKDLIVFLHPANQSGQDCYRVYLLKKENKSFSEELSFCNSIFYPASKTVRGQESDPIYYTFRWNNTYSLDTIEYIYDPIMHDWIPSLPWTDSIHYHKEDYTKNKKIILLDSLPDYYYDPKAEEKQKALFKR